MHEEPGKSNGKTPSAPAPRWREVGTALLSVVAGGLALLGGCISGSSYGGNHAPDFEFLGKPGYEGSSWMGALAAVLAMAMVALVSGLTIRRKAARWLTLLGALVGVLLGAPLFFPIIAPSVWLLAVVYFGCSLIGACVGWIVSLGFRDS